MQDPPDKPQLTELITTCGGKRKKTGAERRIYAGLCELQEWLKVWNIMRSYSNRCVVHDSLFFEKLGSSAKRFGKHCGSICEVLILSQCVLLYTCTYVLCKVLYIDAGRMCLKYMLVSIYQEVHLEEDRLISIPHKHHLCEWSSEDFNSA